MGGVRLHDQTGAMKKTQLFFVSMLFLSASYGQTAFQKSLDVFLKTPMIRVAPDGQSHYVADAVIKNSVNEVHVYKIGTNGVIIWHQRYVTNDLSLRAKSMDVETDGLVIVLSTDLPSTPANSYLLKFNADGSTAWIRQIGAPGITQLFEVRLDPDGFIWLSGLHFQASLKDSTSYFLAKTDPDGTPVAARQSYYRYFSGNGFESCKYTNLTWDYVNNTIIDVDDFESPFTRSFISGTNRGRYSVGLTDKSMHFNEYFTNSGVFDLAQADTSVIFSGWTIDFINGYHKDLPMIGIFSPSVKFYKVTKLTPSLYRPIHSYAGDIIYYVPDDKTLIKFDRKLSPVWAVKLDNCIITDAFQADAAPDGSIYTVRNIGDKTIVARIMPDGTLPVCAGYPQPLPVLSDLVLDDNMSFYPYGYPDQPLPDTLRQFNFAPEGGAAQDYCIRLDASFSVPDTICLGMDIRPVQVDTGGGIQHRWDAGSLSSFDGIPDFLFDKPGLFQVVHAATLGICRDTASEFVRVIPHTVISYGDTVVCGPALFSIDLSNTNADTYYLNGQLTAAKFEITQSGDYTIRVENKACSSEKNIYIRIVPFSPPILAPDTVYCQGTIVQVALNNDFDHVLWDGKPVSDSFAISDGAKHHYMATYKPDSVCMADGYLSLARKSCNGVPEIIYAPNVFAPDAQAQNAYFLPFPTNQALIRSMKVFDRWGSLLFQGNGSAPGWDGTANGRKAGPGVYVYWIEYQDLRDLEIKIKSGDVLLVR
jgi:gliding motility-associated-like protein